LTSIFIFTMKYKRRKEINTKRNKARRKKKYLSGVCYGLLIWCLLHPFPLQTYRRAKQLNPCFVVFLVIHGKQWRPVGQGHQNIDIMLQDFHKLQCRHHDNMLKVLIGWETPLSCVEIVTCHLSKQGDCCKSVIRTHLCKICYLVPLFSLVSITINNRKCLSCQPQDIQ
jgi:hypothetical protein